MRRLSLIVQAVIDPELGLSSLGFQTEEGLGVRA